MKASAGWSEATTGRSQLGRAFVLLLAVLALAVQAVGIYFDVNWHALRYPAFIEVDDRLVIIHADPEAREAGFRVGDRVVEISGQVPETLMGYRKALNDHPAGTKAQVKIERNGTTLTLSVLVARQRLDFQFAIRHLIALCFMAIGTLVAYQRFEDRSARLFFLAALALGLYYALLFKETVALVYIQVFALTLASGLVLHFFMTFPRERLLGGTRLWFLIYIPSLILMSITMRAYAESVGAGTGIWYSLRYEAFSNASFVYLALTGLFGLLSLGYTYLTTSHSIEKRQLQWIIWGVACAVVASIIDIILTQLQLHSALIGGLLLALGVLPIPVAFAFAILRYRLLDIDLVANRSMVYGVLTTILAALYLLLIGILANALGLAASSGSYAVVLFLSALAIGILANPARAYIQGGIDRIFFRQQISYREALIGWSEVLSTSIRFADLTRLLVREVPRELLIDRAWLLVLDKGETHLELLLDEDEPGVAERAQEFERWGVSAHGPFALSLVKPGKIVLLEQRERGAVGHEQGIERASSDQGAPSAWEEAGVRVILPLVSAGQLVGIYLLGFKLSGDIYQRQELGLLRTLANQAAIAIANARLYEEVRAFSQELEGKVRERTKELRDFVSVVYHELSTPMTAIQGYTALLLDGKGGPLEEKQSRYLEAVARSVKRLMRLVGDLSDVSRIDDGRIAIHPEPVYLKRTIGEIIGSLTGIIEEKGLQMEIALDPGAEYVLGDPERVTQIFTNLISNACRYTPAGGRITVASSLMNGVVELIVRDTGIGIPKEDLPRIFERFYRSPDPVVREQHGTGLGLAITKSLVELHESELWVDSRVGKGSTFGFSLPVAEVVDER